jgi:hypothetical protein
METQHGVRVAICHLDNHTVLINKDTREPLAWRGTVFEPSTPYTAHQNAVAESSNRLTETRSRNMLIAALHLPKELWPYAARYAVELLNHYPTTAVPCGKTPCQMLLEHMKVANPVPSLHSVRTFGEPGYVHTPVQKRVKSAKFQPRAMKMYFVGREGSRTIASDGGSRKLCPYSLLTISNIDLTPTLNLILCADSWTSLYQG